MGQSTLPPGGPIGGKDAVRARMLAGRRALAARAAGDAARTAALLGHPLVAGCRVVAAYVSFGTEPDTSGLIRVLVARGVTVLVPTVNPDRSLSFTTVGGRPAALRDAGVVLVPALAVDRRGLRLGRGGGCYDRALVPVDRPVLALLHPGELVERLPAEPHDRPVSGVALPGGVVWLAGPAAPG